MNASSPIPSYQPDNRRRGKCGREGDLPYMDAAGSLNTACPDIVNDTRAMSRHSHDPTAEEVKAVKKVWAYPNGTHTLFYMYREGAFTIHNNSSRRSGGAAVA